MNQDFEKEVDSAAQLFTYYCTRELIPSLPIPMQAQAFLNFDDAQKKLYDPEVRKEMWSHLVTEAGTNKESSRGGILDYILLDLNSDFLQDLCNQLDLFLTSIPGIGPRRSQQLFPFLLCWPEQLHKILYEPDKVSIPSRCLKNVRLAFKDCHLSKSELLFPTATIQERLDDMAPVRF